ncbi:hypothetical protein TanjilG_27682 [Lupinus angustifolius]|uniref:Uncharacterized protein n=1 Tax=Lupinus angustifolius TaxID=3871 RepID=A0A4P1RHG5_LUPAN|nr:hypothetical protein TanjilG_27682 [Lupinus angustifolius]
MHQSCMMEEENQAGSACCFCFSIKKSVVTRNGKSSVVLSAENHVEWGKNDEILSDMSTFSAKEQEKRLKKALEEEKRASIEAERVVQWVKQESARIDTSTIDKIIFYENKE